MLVDLEQNYSPNIWLMLEAAVKMEEDPQHAGKTLLISRLRTFGVDSNEMALTSTSQVSFSAFQFDFPSPITKQSNLFSQTPMGETNRVTGQPERLSPGSTVHSGKDTGSGAGKAARCVCPWLKAQLGQEHSSFAAHPSSQAQVRITCWRLVKPPGHHVGAWPCPLFDTKL